MHTEGNEVHASETEASGGQKTGHVRWILGIGTFLAIIGLSAIWIFGAATQGDVEGEATVSGKISAQEAGDDTDGIRIDTVDDDLDTPETEQERDAVPTIEN